MEPLELKSLAARDDSTYHAELAGTGVRVKLLSDHPLDLTVGAFYALTPVNPPGKKKGK
jgi:hypothetical protein